MRPLPPLFYGLRNLRIDRPRPFLWRYECHHTQLSTCTAVRMGVQKCTGSDFSANLSNSLLYKKDQQLNPVNFDRFPKLRSKPQRVALFWGILHGGHFCPPFCLRGQFTNSLTKRYRDGVTNRYPAPFFMAAETAGCFPAQSRPKPLRNRPEKNDAQRLPLEWFHTRPLR